MVVNKLKTAFILFVSILFLTIIPNHVSAEKERIYDNANLLNNEEKKLLESQAKKLSDKRETDFMIVTITKDTAEDIEAYIQELYDNEQLGYNEPHGNVAILGIDIDRRDVVIHGHKKAKERLAADRIDKVRNEITPDLSDENYFEAFEQYLTLSSDYIRFKPGANPNNVLYTIWGQLLAAVLFASSIVGMMLRHTKPRTTTTAATYRDESRTKINRKRDRYLRKSVTRRLKPKDDSNRTRSSGSRSSPRVGRTRGGHSHSRSRGKF